MQKEGALKTVALGLDHPDVKTKIMVLELLTTVCMVPPNGHRYAPVQLCAPIACACACAYVCVQLNVLSSYTCTG
jgi:hypothetical protein